MAKDVIMREIGEKGARRGLLLLELFGVEVFPLFGFERQTLICPCETSRDIRMRSEARKLRFRLGMS